MLGLMFTAVVAFFVYGFQNAMEYGSDTVFYWDSPLEGDAVEVGFWSLISYFIIFWTVKTIWFDKDQDNKIDSE